MAEELQQLLEKIQRDGVDKANAEAQSIVDKAKKEAQSIVDKAKEEAAAATAKAEADAKAFGERANTTIKQAARDTVLEVRESVNRFFERLLAQDVKVALADNAAALAADAGKALAAGADAQVAANAQLAEALRAQFAAGAAKGVTVVTDAGNTISRRRPSPPRSPNAFGQTWRRLSRGEKAWRPIILFRRCSRCRSTVRRRMRPSSSSACAAASFRQRTPRPSPP